jgi:predicted dehydrogenase
MTAEEAPNRSYAEDPVGFVVVGLGMGRPRSKEILETPGCELVGVCDLDVERARAVGEDFGVPWKTDLAEWLDDERAEVIFCLTPTGLHKKVCVPALRAGRHALTTKPMEASLEACEEMIAAADEAGRIMAVDFELRTRPRVQELKAAVRKGVFGRILSATGVLKVLRTDEYFKSNGGWRGTRKFDGGGAFSNQAIHNIDEIVYVLGAPDEVRCDIWTQNHDIEAEDLGIATWRYADGKIVSFYATTCYPQKTWYERLEIHGTEAAYARGRGGPMKAEEVNWFVGGEWRETAPVEPAASWLNSMDNLAAAIRTGAELLCSARDGRATQAVLDAMYRSAACGGGWTAVKASAPAGALG